MNNLELERKGIMTKSINVNRKITKIMLVIITVSLLGMGAYFGFQSSVKIVEGQITQLIQSDNIGSQISVSKK